MGYGIVGELANGLLIWNGYDDDYGEVQTQTRNVGGYGNPDVSIHVALNTWEIYTPWRTDNASVGLAAYVLDGNLTTFDTIQAWPTELLANPVTSFRVGYHLSGNGGYLKASWMLQLWGDPATDDRGLGKRMVEPGSAQVVYDPATGSVRHIHSEISLGDAPVDDLLGNDAIQIARSMGHGGELAVVEVSAGDLLAGSPQRVDPGSQRLVAAPRGEARG